jgi:hypothetical protein
MLTCRLNQDLEKVAAAKRSFKFKKVHTRAKLLINEFATGSTSPVQASDIQKMLM